MTFCGADPPSPMTHTSPGLDISVDVKTVPGCPRDRSTPAMACFPVGELLGVAALQRDFEQFTMHAHVRQEENRLAVFRPSRAIDLVR